MPGMIEDRKLTQLRICLEHDVQRRHASTHLERYRLQRVSERVVAPEAVDLSCEFLGRRLSAPILIGAMTGGTEAAGPINRNLAAAAQALGVAMAVGSQRAAVENRSLRSSYRVREVAPDIVLLANLGIAQLGQGWGAAECRAAVEMIQADGLTLHYNPWQEAAQEPETADLSQGLRVVAQVVKELLAPVIVKEVGWGLPEEVAMELWGYGVRHFDTGGAGGTCWAEVLRYSPEAASVHPLLDRAGAQGIPTAEVIRSLRRALPTATIIAGGGIRSGEDIARAIALGADLVSIAHPLLRPASISVAAVRDYLEALMCESRAAVSRAGARTVTELRGACEHVNPDD